MQNNDMWKNLFDALRNNKIKNKSPINSIDTCRKCGNYDIITNKNKFTVCRQCGAVDKNVPMNDQPEFIPNGGVILKNIIQINQHVAVTVTQLHEQIYDGRINTRPDDWIRTVKSVYKEILERRTKKMKGMKLIIVVGIIIEIMLMKDNNPLIRPLLIEFINRVNKKQRLKTKDYEQITTAQYEKYRTDPHMGIRTTIEKIIGKYEKHSIRSYTNFASNIFGIDKVTRLKIAKFADIIEIHKILLGLDMKTNDELAACAIFLHTTEFYNKEKPKTIMGIKTAQIINIASKISNSKISVVAQSISLLNLPDTLFRQPSKKPIKKASVSIK